LVVIGAVAAALINELHGGWGWWVAAGVVVLGWAAATAAVSLRVDGGRVRLGAGAVYAGGNVRGGVATHTSGRAPSLGPGDGTELGLGAVFVRGDITGPVQTTTSLGD
jgi:hypothetical protein